MLSASIENKQKTSPEEVETDAECVICAVLVILVIINSRWEAKQRKIIGWSLEARSDAPERRERSDNRP